MATGKPTIHVLAAVFAAAFSANAADHLYVGGANGTYATIQAAVDAASAGDVIHVAAGTYATGGKEDTFIAGGKSFPMTNRVYITKSLTICGEDKHRTFIVGSRASVAEDAGGIGLGTDAVRCIGINADDVVISNLTITGGATKVPTSSADNYDGNGGGIYAMNGKSGIYIVDCIISNNVAYRTGAMRYGNDNSFGMTAVRCWIHGNRSIDYDPATRGTMLVHCLVTHHSYGSALIYSGKLVNCTFADNHCRAVCNQKTTAANCFFADCWVKCDANGSSYENCGIPLAETGVTTSSTNEHCLFSIGFDQFVAPLRKDFRLHPGANVLNAGDMSLLASLSIPDAYKYTDYYGNEIDRTAETCHLGCCQNPVAPVGGKVRFANLPSSNALTGGYTYTLSVDNTYAFDGAFEMPMRTDLAYVRAMTWPDFVKVEVETRQWAGQYGFSASGADTVWRYPYLDGTYEIAIPKAVGAELVLTPKAADSVVYVRQSPAAASPAGTAEAPDTDLQTAIGRVGSYKYGIVYCLGENTVDSGKVKCDASIISNRLCVVDKHVRIVGVDGPEKNVIVGAPDPTVALDTYPYGMGPGAIRCVYLAGTSAIQGFTLTGGRSDSESASDNRAKRGAGAFLNAAGAQMTDCVVSNCVGNSGVAVCGPDGKVSNAYAFRCLFTSNRQYNKSGNESAGGIIRFANGGMLVLSGNTGPTCGTYESLHLYNCSIANDAGGDGVAFNSLSYATTNHNCAVRFTNANSKFNSTVVFGGIVQFTGGAMHSSSTFAVRGDPLFAFPSDGDLRLAAMSPARTSGTFDGVDALYHVFMGRDFYGNPYRVENGKPLCGAVHAFAPTVVSSGGWISPSGTNVYASAGATVEFTATAARPLVGFLVNGETQQVASATYSFTVPAADDYSAPFSVSALYDTKMYVDKAGGNDAWIGSAEFPKRTLVAALTNAVSGDVVYAAPGAYDEGSFFHSTKVFDSTTDFRVASRAYIPSGVSLVSQGSAADTFIVGSSATAPVASGCGPDAVRGVFMEEGARLSGFTVTGGRTDAAAGDSSDNTAAGGILARNDTAIVSDCIISNNVAQRGGGVYFGTYNRCRFIDNTALNVTGISGNGSAVHGENGAPESPRTAKLSNCVVADNFGWSTVYYGALDNCTLTADNRDHNGNTDGMTILNACGRVRNTLILGHKAIVGACGLTRCAYSAATAGRFDTPATSNDCIVASSSDDLAMDGFTPVIGSNIAVDAGDASLYDAAALGDEDVYGNPRAVNGRRLDIGAVEAPWLGEYTAALCSRFVAVTSASPEVELTASGVLVPGGASIAASVHGAGRERAVTLSVAEGGACNVALDGASIASFSSGEGQTLNVTPSRENAELVFSATGAETVISQFRSLVGGLLIVR